MSDLSETVGATVQAMVAQAQALGISWNLRLATVVTISGQGVTIVFDGDTMVIAAVNMCGIPLTVGDRVYVVMIPTTGNYIVGLNRTIGYVARYSNFSASGTTVSGSFVNMPGSPSMSIRVDEGSSLLLTIMTSCYTDVAATSVQYGFSVNGSNYTAVHFNFNQTGTHHQMGGQRIILSKFLRPGAAVTINGIWVRAGGGGTLAMDGNDWVSMTAQTVTTE